MRSTLFLTLLFIVAAVNCGPLPSKEAEELVQDGNYDASKIAKEDGNGAVELIGRGYVDLVVSSGSLFVGVDIQGCKGKVLFCYAAKSGESQTKEDAEDLCRGLSNFCGFQLIGTDDKITFSKISSRKTRNELGECSSEIKMEFPEAKYCNQHDVSCNAAISAEDGRIRIHVKDADPDNCPVSIKYAKIYVPPTTTPVPTTAPPSKATSSNGTKTKNDDKAADASSQELTWIVLGCLIGVIILGLIGGILLCWLKKWCMFKKNTTETLPPPVESIVSTTVTTKADENVTVDEKPKEEMAKVEKPEIVAAPAKKSEKALPVPPPPSAEPAKKPQSTAKSAKKTKEKKGMTSPATAATPSKKAPKEKKLAPAPPGKKPAEKQRVPAPSAEKKVSKETTKSEKRSASTQSYSPPFCLLPVRAPSPPPRKPMNPEHLEHRRRGGKKDSLELPSYSGGKPVYSQYAIEKQRKEKAAAEARKKKKGSQKK